MTEKNHINESIALFNQPTRADIYGTSRNVGKMWDAGCVLVERIGELEAQLAQARTTCCSDRPGSGFICYRSNKAESENAALKADAQKWMAEVGRVDKLNHVAESEKASLLERAGKAEREHNTATIRVRELETECNRWRADDAMWVRALTRELDGYWVHKMHMIDSVVLSIRGVISRLKTMQGDRDAIYEKWKALAATGDEKP